MTKAEHAKLDSFYAAGGRTYTERRSPAETLRLYGDRTITVSLSVYESYGHTVYTARARRRRLEAGEQDQVRGAVVTFQPGPAMRAPALAALCLLALATRLPAEPPTGSYLLAVVATSDADGIEGPQLGILAGRRARVSDSIALLFEASALHSPKIDAGDGYLLAAMFDVEHWGKRWYGALGVSWAVQETSAYSKEAWAPRLTIGRQAGSVRLSGTWSFPDSTLNRTGSLGLGLEWRRGRGVLRAGLAWLRHRDGEGIRLSWAAGLAW